MGSQGTISGALVRLQTFSYVSNSGSDLVAMGLLPNTAVEIASTHGQMLVQIAFLSMARLAGQVEEGSGADRKRTRVRLSMYKRWSSLETRLCDRRCTTPFTVSTVESTLVSDLGLHPKGNNDAQNQSADPIPSCEFRAVVQEAR